MLRLSVGSAGVGNLWGRWVSRAAAGAAILWAAASLPAQPGPIEPRAGVSPLRPEQGPTQGQEAVALPSEASTNWWTQAQKQLQDSEYQASKAESGALQAPNRAQNLRSWFDESGALTVPRDAASPEAAAWQWGLSLQRYGWQGGEMLAVAPAAPVAEKNTVTYQRSPLLREWYVNEAAGLKSWFEIKSAPPGSGSSLRLELAVRGDTVATMGTGEKAQTVEFRTETGASVIQYSGLKAWDATGRALACTLSLSGGKTVVLNVDAAGAQFPVTIDPLASSPGLTLEGDQANSGFGYCVASAGDVNDDGFSDIIVGAPWYDNGQTQGGRAFVYHGSASGLSLTAAWTTGTNRQFSDFGESVASAGDVNGDGYSDVIIGAASYSVQGRAYVYLGSASGLVTTPAWIGEGSPDTRYFGENVASAGDVNGDGYSDIIVSAPIEAFPVGYGPGKKYVYHGSATGLASSPAWTVVSGDRGMEEFTTLLASAGDVNGDGYSDIIIGEPTFADGQPNEGRAIVYLGSASGLADSPAWTAESNQAGTFFGYSVASAGDVNGDGYSDVIVGAPDYDNGQTDEGRAYVYLGSATGLTTSPAWTAESDEVDANFGRIVASGGDVNGDGYSDVLVAAHHFYNERFDVGPVSVYLGSASGLTTSPVWIAVSDLVGSPFRSMASAGDVDGDGYSDIIAGSPPWSGIPGYPDSDDSADKGRIVIFYGFSGPAINVTCAGYAIRSGDTTPAINDLTDFGPAAVNLQVEQAPVRTFFINNYGAEPLLVTTVSLSNASFEVGAPNDFPVSVQPGASALVRIRAVPKTPGQTSATVSLSSNDTKSPLYTFTVQAEGVHATNSTLGKVDNFPGTAGWLELGIPDSSLPVLGNPPGLGSRGYDPVNTALLMTLMPNAQSRVIGFREDPETDLPYSSIGPDKVARATFGIYSVPAPGSNPSSDPNALSSVPNFRLRLMQNFVINSMREVNHNSGNTDPAIRPLAREFAPSTDPAKPSIYHVDLDPVEIPYLLGSAGATVGVQRGVETVGVVNALAPDYQYVQGTIGLTDSSVGTYPIPTTTKPPVKVYGDSVWDFSGYKSILTTMFTVDRDSLFAGVVSDLNTITNIRVYGSGGITVDTYNVTQSRVAVAAIDFLNGNVYDESHPEARLRVDPERLYKVSFRLSSNAPTTFTPLIRLRARTAKFQWAQVLELGGVASVGSVTGRTIAAQALPGSNSQNLNSDASGQWYHMWFQSPITSSIRPDVPGTLFDKFPLLMTQPGMGDPSPQSARDLKIGFDVIDTLSTGPGQETEAAYYLTLNRIEIRDYPQVDMTQP